ncbi:NAD-binding protein [Lactarius quietus]|nr:NAD-binding protein [Lactarius quietus]
MSGYKNFAVVGAGTIGTFIIHQLLTDKAAGTIDDVVVLTRQGSKSTVGTGAKLVTVDYSNKESVKKALAGVDVLISALPGTALDVQPGIAEVAKEAGVKLFVPSEFGGPTEGATEGLFGAKAKIQEQLKAIGIPYALFYSGPFADFIWAPYLGLDIANGKVSVGGDGSKQISFTSRTDIARFVSYVLTHLPADQLKNRSFTMAGDTKSLNEIVKEYEVRTGKKVEVTYVPVSELDARLASNPQDSFAFLHKLWATTEVPSETDNHVYPDWNPSSVVDNIPIA